MSRESEEFKKWYATVNEGNSFGNQRADSLAGYIQGKKERDELKAENVALEEQILQMHEGLTLVEQENNELKAELEQCLTAHAMLNDKVCALESVNVTLEEQLLQMHEGLTLAETEINKLEARIKELKG